MAVTIPLISALRLLRKFGDDPYTVEVIDKTIAELERLDKVEAELIALKEQPAPDPADWAAANALVRQQ